MKSHLAVESPNSVASAVSQQRKRYILIVDDEPRIIHSLVRELSEWAASKGLTVTGSVLGKLALEFLEEHGNEVEVVIADIRMPGMSGGDMAQSIRELYPHIKVIVLSAYNDKEELDKARVESVISKPWEKQELIEEIEGAIE
mgnify:CR=1 FL=1